MVLAQHALHALALHALNVPVSSPDAKAKRALL